MNVIFDTNAAREYVAKIDDESMENYIRNNIKKLNKKGTKFLINPIVIQELLYHLTDTSDRDYNVSYKAIKAMIITAKYQNEDCTGIPIMASPESIIANDLFKLRIKERERMYSNLMNLVTYIVDNPIKSVQKETQMDLNTNKDWMDDVESSFNEQIRSIIDIVKSSYGGDIRKLWESDESNFILSFYILRTPYNLLLAEKLINPMDLSQLKKKSEALALKYPSFIALFKSVVQRIMDGLKSEKLYMGYPFNV